MKKYLLLTICLLSSAALRAQTYTSGRLTVVVSYLATHDSTQCMCQFTDNYTITVDSSFAGDTVRIVDTSTGQLLGASPYVNTAGASPWTFPAFVYGYTNDDYHALGGAPGVTFFTPPVTKVVCDYDTVKYIDTVYPFPVSNPCTYSTVQGYMYIDNNTDCIFDSGDVGLNNIAPSITENLSSSVGSMTYIPQSIWLSTGSPGWYEYVIQQSWMTGYTVFAPPYLAFIFPYSPCFTGYSPFTTLPEANVGFPLQCSNNCDVQCNALTPPYVRLDRSFYVWPYVSNTGCDSESGEFRFILDSRVIYDSALSFYPPDSVHGDTLIWNYTNLTNLSGGAYWNDFLSQVYLSLDSTVVVGDTLCFSGYTPVPAADIDPLNNAFSFCIPVVYSYDPNAKVVSPRGTGAPGYIPPGHDTLTYSLHFMNTGSATAVNINIIDTLDSHIDAASLKILGTSADMLPQWLAPGIVEFTFTGINLPDSTDDFAASQGAVQFKVALNSGLAPGTPIRNTAYIYFDSNPAVVTNTTLNTIDTAVIINLGTAPIVKNNTITIYPNPATTQLTIQSSNQPITQITITNLLGQTVYADCHGEPGQTMQTAPSSCLLTQVDVSALSPGVYFVKINGTEIRKFVKE